MFMHMEMLMWVCICLCISVHLCLWVSNVNKMLRTASSPLGCPFFSAYYVRCMAGCFEFFVCLNFFEHCSDPVRWVIVLPASPFCR